MTGPGRGRRGEPSSFQDAHLWARRAMPPGEPGKQEAGPWAGGGGGSSQMSPVLSGGAGCGSENPW